MSDEERIHYLLRSIQAITDELAALAGEANNTARVQVGEPKTREEKIARRKGRWYDEHGSPGGMYCMCCGYQRQERAGIFCRACLRSKQDTASRRELAYHVSTCRWCSDDKPYSNKPLCPACDDSRRGYTRIPPKAEDDE